MMPAKVIIAIVLISLFSEALCSPPAAEIKFEPRASKWGEQLLREAYKSFKEGNYNRAYELAKRVYDKEGDVWAAWLEEGIKLPPGVQVNPYNYESILQAMQEYRKRYGGFMNYFKHHIAVNSAALLVHSLFKLNRYEELERYAVDLLTRYPEAGRIRSVLDASRRLRRKKEGKEPLDHSLLVELPDGRRVIIDVERGRRERAGALYTPAGDIAYLLGLHLEQQGNRATFQGRGIKAIVQVGSDQVQINGRSFKLPKPPYMKDKELLVPIELLQQLAKSVQR